MTFGEDVPERSYDLRQTCSGKRACHSTLHNSHCYQSYAGHEDTVVKRRQLQTLNILRCTDLSVTTIIYSPPIPLFSNTKGKMPPLPISRPSDWNNNVYVLATIRVFVMIGFAYLLKALYSLVPSIRGARSAPVAAGGLSFPCHFDICTQVV